MGIGRPGDHIGGYTVVVAMSLYFSSLCFGRIPVVWLLWQHRLWRCLLAVLCGRQGEGQGPVLQSGPHESPQQWSREKGNKGQKSIRSFLFIQYSLAFFMDALNRLFWYPLPSAVRVLCPCKPSPFKTPHCYLNTLKQLWYSSWTIPYVVGKHIMDLGNELFQKNVLRFISLINFYYASQCQGC